MSFDGANIQQFPDIPAVSAEILALIMGTGCLKWIRWIHSKTCPHD